VDNFIKQLYGFGFDLFGAMELLYFPALSSSFFAISIFVSQFALLSRNKHLDLSIGLSSDINFFFPG